MLSAQHYSRRKKVCLTPKGFTFIFIPAFKEATLFSPDGSRMVYKNVPGYQKKEEKKAKEIFKAKIPPTVNPPGNPPPK